jgi:hypothetical protein
MQLNRHCFQKHCKKNWWKITLAPLGAADQTIRAMENNFDVCNGHFRFFSSISDVNFQPFQSFLIVYTFQKMEIPDFS